MNITIKYKSSGKWNDIDVEPLLFMPRNHFLDLFSGKVPVIICQDGKYLTNSEEVVKMYRKQGKECGMLADVARDDRALEEVGFI